MAPTKAPPQYTVEKRPAENSEQPFAIVNTRFDGVESRYESRDEAERWARFLNRNEYDYSASETDSDWVPGSNRHWWALHSGEEGVSND